MTNYTQTLQSCTHNDLPTKKLVADGGITSTKGQCRPWARGMRKGAWGKGRVRRCNGWWEASFKETREMYAEMREGRQGNGWRDNANDIVFSFFWTFSKICQNEKENQKGGPQSGNVAKQKLMRRQGHEMTEMQICETHGLIRLFAQRAARRHSAALSTWRGWMGL